MPKTSHSRIIETRLTDEDFQKLTLLAGTRRQSYSDFARQAIKWYLDNIEKLDQNSRNTELTQTLQNMTNRICGMLARQGVQVGTLFELAWQNHADNNLQERFVSATNTVKQNMRKRLSEDERLVAEKMGRVVG